MKKLILAAATFILIFSSCTRWVNEKDIPYAVTDAFKKEYPDKADVKWEKKGSDYEAKYKDPNEDLSILYDKNGNLIEMEHKVELSALPADVRSYTDENAPGKSIAAAYRVTDKDGRVSYEAVVEETTYVFDSIGNYTDKKQKAGDNFK